MALFLWQLVRAGVMQRSPPPPPPFFSGTQCRLWEQGNGVMMHGDCLPGARPVAYFCATWVHIFRVACNYWSARGPVSKKTPH